jgi:small subunit ribosomal protein S16
VAVKIRLKRLGRTHRPYYRICIMDGRSPRDGKAIEEVGTYDPMIPDVDKSVTMKSDRIDYWLSVGAQPTPKVGTLIKKYKGNVPDKRVEKRKIPKTADRLSAEPRKAAEAPSSEEAPTAAGEGET